MMPLQRACGAESQARNTLSNGPLRVQSNVIFHRVFCDIGGRHHLPGICWYPAKRTGHSVNQGGTADNTDYSSLTERLSLSRAFSFTPLADCQRSFLLRGIENEHITQAQ